MKEALLQEQLNELFYRRAKRVESALLVSLSQRTANMPSERIYGFSGWLKLLPDGKVMVGGETFDSGAAFVATAKDKQRIIRAQLTCAGFRSVEIKSHGVLYVATWNGTTWEVKE